MSGSYILYKPDQVRLRLLFFPGFLVSLQKELDNLISILF